MPHIHHSVGAAMQVEEERPHTDERIVGSYQRARACRGSPLVALRRCSHASTRSGRSASVEHHQAIGWVPERSCPPTEEAFRLAREVALAV